MVTGHHYTCIGSIFVRIIGVYDPDRNSNKFSSLFPYNLFRCKNLKKVQPDSKKSGFFSFKFSPLFLYHLVRPKIKKYSQFQRIFFKRYEYFTLKILKCIFMMQYQGALGSFCIMGSSEQYSTQWYIYIYVINKLSCWVLSLPTSSSSISVM